MTLPDLSEVKRWDETQRQTFLDNLRLQAAQTRYPTPASMAQALLPGYNVTPTIDIISDAVADAVLNENRRYLITTPPRSGKSELVSVVGPVYAQLHKPGAEVVLVSYADLLATDHSRKSRQLIIEHADQLGIRLGGDKKAVGHWVTTHGTGRGGLLAGGILAGLTGFGANLLILDDVLKNRQEADSPTLRRRISNEFRSTLMTRLYPGASVVVTMTRWHPADLAGELIEEGGWTHINIPAQAQPGVPDALNRPNGEWVQSALGFTPEDYQARRAAIGERAWNALYQGVPTPPEGGLVQAAWFKDWRVPAPPEHPLMTVVGVDPSDSGAGDSCGIVAASIGQDQTVVVHRDISAPMTSEQWASAAVDLAVDTGASEIAVEGFAARETYVRVVKETLRRKQVARPIKVSSWPPKGSGRGGGDAIARSAALLQGLETGTCRIAGTLPGLEDAAVLWHAGQHQPDQLAALVVAHDVLVHAVGQKTTFGSPLKPVTPNRERQAWLGRKIG